MRAGRVPAALREQERSAARCPVSLRAGHGRPRAPATRTGMGPHGPTRIAVTRIERRKSESIPVLHRDPRGARLSVRQGGREGNGWGPVGFWNRGRLFAAERFSRWYSRAAGQP